ncbi:MAG: hypothetical protein P8Y69_02055 [Gammaproteobacteria bacterium]
MIFLILKMFVYLFLALVAGGAAGWILRHIAAARQDEEMQRTLADARARVPQFESLIRSRDEQINRLKEDMKDKDVRINALLDEARDKENELRDKVREARQLAARNEALEMTEGTTAAKVADGAGEATVDVEGDSAGAEKLKAELARLERELADARVEAADALAEAATAAAEVVTLKAELDRAGGGEVGAGREVYELEVRLKQKAEEYDRLVRDLEMERRRVVELERERELQNKSLQVLHQQLELERERNQRVASG